METISTIICHDNAETIISRTRNTIIIFIWSQLTINNYNCKYAVGGILIKLTKLYFVNQNTILLMMMMVMMMAKLFIKQFCVHIYIYRIFMRFIKSNRRRISLCHAIYGVYLGKYVNQSNSYINWIRKLTITRQTFINKSTIYII